MIVTGISTVLDLANQVNWGSLFGKTEHEQRKEIENQCISKVRELGYKYPLDPATKAIVGLGLKSACYKKGNVEDAQTRYSRVISSLTHEASIWVDETENDLLNLANDILNNSVDESHTKDSALVDSRNSKTSNTKNSSVPALVGVGLVLSWLFS